MNGQPQSSQEKTKGKERRFRHESAAMKAGTVFVIVVSVMLIALGILLIYAAGVILGSSAGPVFSWELAIPGIIMICIGVIVLAWVWLSQARA